MSFASSKNSWFASAQDATRLSHMRYSGGVASYLEVLTNDTNYFSAELGWHRPSLTNYWPSWNSTRH